MKERWLFLGLALLLVLPIWAVDRPLAETGPGRVYRRKGRGMRE